MGKSIYTVHVNSWGGYEDLFVGLERRYSSHLRAVQLGADWLRSLKMHGWKDQRPVIRATVSSEELDQERGAGVETFVCTMQIDPDGTLTCSREQWRPEQCTS